MKLIRLLSLALVVYLVSIEALYASRENLRVLAGAARQAARGDTATALEVCEGQQYDMDFEKRNDVDIAEYLKMIRLKTAVLLGASLKIGALVANASDEQAALIYDFGVNVGTAFQIKDDIMNIEGGLGKEYGDDIKEGKRSLMIIHALKLATEEDKKKGLHEGKFGWDAPSNVGITIIGILYGER